MESPNPSTPGCDSSAGAEPGESQSVRIACVLEIVEQRLDAGETIDDAAIIAENPELMPELAERLRDIRLLHQALNRATERSNGDEALSEHAALLDEQFDFLRDELERYEVLDVVHHGGQGIVFRARQKSPSRIVALKVLLNGPLASQRQLHRFDRELELIARLNHPNIVTVYDSGEVRNRPYFTMEFVDGCTISDYLLLKDLTPHQVVRLMVKVCRAVHYAHQNGIIHRDLKPSNILVDADGQPHVFDFGLAKDLRTVDDNKVSMTGQVLGTLPYLSPEQAGGLDRQVDVRSDVYALGVVLYYLLTDVFPYPVDGEATDVRNAIVSTEPAPLRKVVALGGAERAAGLEQINADLEAILDKTLAKRKSERYQSAAELAADLERYCAGEAVAARRGQRVYRLRKALRRYRTPLAVVAVLLAAAAISWVQVRAQRDNARMAARIAVDEFSTTLSDVEQRVRPLAGGVAVCDALVERVASEIPRLEALVGSDEALAPVLAQLSEKQGDIARLRGRNSEARGYYRRFLDAGLGGLRANPGDSASAVRAVRGYRRLGEVSEEPIPTYEQGVQFAPPLLARFPECEALKLELAELYRSLATESLKADNYQLACEQYAQIVDLLPRKNEESQYETAWKLLEASATEGRGNALAELGEADEALEALNESRRLREAFLVEHPTDTASRYELLRSHRVIARHLKTWERLDEAKQHLAAAAKIVEFLLAMDPEMSGWSADAFVVYHQLATLHLKANEPEQASEYCARTLEFAENKVDRYGETDDALSDLAFALALRGRVFAAEASWANARDWLLRAVETRERLLEADPDSIMLMNQLSPTLGELGLAYRNLGDVPNAILVRTRACELRERVVELQPNVPKEKLDLITSQNNLAAAYLDTFTKEGYSQAARLLAAARNMLDLLRDSDAMSGYEPMVKRQDNALRKNEDLLRRRLSSPESEHRAQDEADY